MVGSHATERGKPTPPPDDDELEVSIFGPGYGECVLLHLGRQRWAIIDSCVSERGGQPAALTYLRGLGVDEASAVQLILATHWHDDHIRGLATTVETCPDASFYCSTALRQPELLTLIRAMEPRALMDTSGVHEFGRVMDVLASRRKAGTLIGDPPGLAIANRAILRDVGPPEVTLTALSPSDAAVTKALGGFAAGLLHRR